MFARLEKIYVTIRTLDADLTIISRSMKTDADIITSIRSKEICGNSVNETVL